MRKWQQPLNDEQIKWLQEQFEIARIRIEKNWGGGLPPWVQNRRDE
jgi:hypothetical protein